MPDARRLIVALSLITVMCAASGAPAATYAANGASPRENLCLNGSWEMLSWAETKPDPEYDQTLVWPPASKGGWDPFLLPANLMQRVGEGSPQRDQQPAWRSVGYASGTAWFRRTVEVPADWAGKRILFRCGGVNYDATVYINGTFVGRHRNQLPFVFDATDAIKPGQANEICLGYIGPQVARDQDGNVLEPDGDAMVYCPGPWGDVYLEPVGEAHVSAANIIPRWENKQLHVDVELSKRTKQALTLNARIREDSAAGGAEVKSFAPARIEAGDQNIASVALDLAWPDVRPWTSDDPHLYVLELTVADDAGAVQDCWRERFGFRSFVARDGAFYLNDARVNLKCSAAGVSYSGQFFDPESIRALYRALKSINLNSIRLHGMPFPTVWLDVADEEGMLLIVEGMFVPGVWDKDQSKRTSYLFDKRPQRFADYFAQWTARDRNHPSVIMWSAYNEPQDDFPFARLFDVIRQNDRSGRPVFCDGHTDPWADAISIHYACTPISTPGRDAAFPYWPDDLYFMDAPQPAAALFDRWAKWYYPPSASAEVRNHYDERVPRLRTLARLPFDQRWVLGDDPDRRPLSIGEEHKTWMYSMDELSRFVGDAAYRGIYDVENGALWRGFGKLEGEAVEAFRYMGVNHYCLPWHPGTWALAAIYQDNGETIVKELGTPLENTPGYHPYRMVADRSRVNPPGWDASQPETIVTAAGVRLREAYAPLRLIVPPEQRSYLPSQTLSRAFAVSNDSARDATFKVQFKLGDRTILDKPYDVAAGCVARDEFSIPLAGAAMGEQALVGTLDGVEAHRETIRVAAQASIARGPVLAVFDPAGKTLAALRKLGGNVRRIPSLDHLTKPAAGDQQRDILVIGENALSDKTNVGPMLIEWLNGGGGALILAQSSFGGLEELIGKSVSVLNLPNSLSFARSADHPILAGLTDDDLMLWGADHRVTQTSIQIERLANAHVIADQGSYQGLVHPAIAELFRRRGRIVLVQALCVQKLEESPAASAILANAVSHLASPQARPFSPIEVRDSGLRRQLSRRGVRIEDDAEVLLIGPRDALYARDLQADARRRVIWISKPSPKQLAMLTEQFGALDLKPTRVNHSQLEFAEGVEPIVRGATSRQLIPPGRGPMARQVIDIETLGGGWSPVLVEPAYTCEKDDFGGMLPRTIEIDRHTVDAPRRRIDHPGAAMVVRRLDDDRLILVDTIEWKDFDNDPGVGQFLDTLLTNLGVAISLGDEEPDDNAIGITNQPAIYRVDCGNTAGQEMLERVIRADGMDEKRKVRVAYTDHAGNRWLADQRYDSNGFGYVGGGQTVEADPKLEVSDTIDDALFRTQRYGMSSYRFDLPNGPYRLRLFFAETYDGISSTGMRRFSVNAQGKPFVADLDLFDVAGLRRAVVIEKTVDVDDGVLNVEFVRGVQEPMINAIEVLPAS